MNKTTKNNSALYNHLTETKAALRLLDQLRSNLESRRDEAETADINWGHVNEIKKAHVDLAELVKFLNV